MDPHQATMADTMDTDSATSSGVGVGGGPGSSAGTANAGNGQAQVQFLESVWSLIVMARQLIDQGKAPVALQVIMAAVRAQGGENAVFQTLQRARELYRNKVRENAAADELASLFAECAIAEVQPGNPIQPQSSPFQPAGGGLPSTLLDGASDTSILAESGRKQVMLDAFSDGSSFICLKCGGLVSNIRKDEHLAYWCGKF